MEVAARRHEQPELPGEAPEAGLLGGPVVGMKDFHGVQPDSGERPQEGFRVPVPDRVSDGGNTARLSDRRHHLDRRPFLRPHVPGMLAGEKPFESVVVGDGVAGAHQRARQMGPPPHPVPDVPPDRAEVERIAGRDQVLRHLLAPAAAFLLAFGQPRVEGAVVLVHEEGEDVDVILALEVRRDLGAGDQLDAEPVRFFPRLRKPGQRVVVGQREGLNPREAHAPRERRRRIEAVGDRGMAVEVDAHPCRDVTFSPPLF